MNKKWIHGQAARFSLLSNLKGVYYVYFPPSLSSVEKSLSRLSLQILGDGLSLRLSSRFSTSEHHQ